MLIADLIELKEGKHIFKDVGKCVNLCVTNCVNIWNITYL